MADVSVENILLKESFLTSTKNKYLIEDKNYEGCAFNRFYALDATTIKRKLPSNLLEDWKVTCIQNSITSTENKFLETYSTNSQKKSKKCRSSKKTDECGNFAVVDDSFVSKKKRKKYRSARMEVEREIVAFNDEDEQDFTLPAYCMPEKGTATFGGRDLPMFDECSSDSLGTLLRSPAAAFGSPGAAFGSPGAAFGSSAAAFGSSAAVFGAPPAVFGSICASKTTQNRSLLKKKTCASFGQGVDSNDCFAPRGMAAFPNCVQFPTGSSCPEVFCLKIPPISEMPVYSFDLQEDFRNESYEPFDFMDFKASSLEFERIKNVNSKKIQFLNAASMALICKTNLMNPSDPYRLLLKKYADDVRAYDPEFILKVALYSRLDLNIRSASNFLLSYAAYYDETRTYLRKYFETCIKLPSDWIEVAELYQVFADQRLQKRSLPTSLKKVMVKSFSKFDAYQLAKYNRNKSKRKNGKKVLNLEICDTDDESKNVYYTLKQLIRMLHLSSPANEVMCLLGKKYPETVEAFTNSGLPGFWDSKRAGKRMKLPQPETWETQISLYGNAASIWEKLIDNCKLPYMAMLRNMKNLILSGISLKHHEKVLNQLENKVAVLNSRQLPLQFHEAFKILLTIEELVDEDDLGPSKIPINTPFWKRERLVKTFNKIQNASNQLLDRYKNAVSKALELSALHNLQPIPGKSLIICDVLLPDDLISKSTNKAYQLCVMMGLMCLRACEDCKMNLIYGDFSEKIFSNDVPLLQTLAQICYKLDNMHQDVQGKSSVKALNHVLEHFLKQQTYFKERLDHVIYLRTFETTSYSQERKTMTSFLHKYRQLINPELLYTDVDFSTSKNSFLEDDSSDGKDVYLCGNTTQLIKFIAERSTGGQLTCVENIDEKYKLKNDADFKRFKKATDVQSETKILPVLPKVPKWHTVKIFISSTFKDMHSERDMLIRYVIPELRKRAASVYIKINEVDLRWGITETDCNSKRAAELCLLEAQNSDLFVGILGDRYGTIYSFDPPESPDLHWVKECAPGLSITELEMYAGALNESKLKEKKAFFYIRQNKFLKYIALKELKSFFMPESPESKLKVEALKSKIVASGLKVYDGYPCEYAGVLKDKPILNGLDSFGRAVLDDLWAAVLDLHNKEPFVDDIAEEEIHQQHLLNSFDYLVESKTFPVGTLIKKIQNESGIFLISGAPGSGKTTFLVNVLKKLNTISIVKFFVGLTPRSTDLSYMLHFICESISRCRSVSSAFPNLTKDVINQFPDILHEAVNSLGSTNFLLVIDGLDHLEIDDQMLDWLPLNLPQGLRIVFTASDSSYAFRVLCQRELHGTSIHIFDLPGIVQSDRECIVRQYLKLYGKALDESPFNNQMLQLITKKDSCIPLYLRISCDFLRTYASFDNFMSMLQSLPSTIPLLLQEIILQMENEFTPILVQAALTLLCITTEGLDDADLHLLLSLVLLDKGKTKRQSFSNIVNQINELNLDNLLSRVTYCSLVHLICTFAYGHNRFRKFNLNGTEFEKAIKKFYLNKNYTNFAIDMHCNVAAYYLTICDPEKDGSWKGRSGSAYRGLIYHLFYGKCFKFLLNNLCCLKFLEAIFSIGAADSLLEYYSLLIKEAQIGNSEAKKEVDVSLLTSFEDFVSRNLHIFQKYPHLVMQQALNEPSTSVVKLKLQSFQQSKCNMIECLSIVTLDPRVATLGGFTKNITSASYQSSLDIALLGSEDGYLKVLDLMSKKITRSYRSHSSSITSICFAGKNWICTASSDTTLSIWSSVDYSRIFVLKGHKHTVSCVCADSSSNILFSSGWDNSVRLWSLRDGRSISVLDDFRCPVNCLDHHPTKQQIACGLWDGNIELWDTVSLKKLLTLSNNCRSVKTLSYLPDGINIVSSYMNSDVVIWSSEQGLKMSSLKGHSLPVRSISYPTTGDMIVTGSEDSTLKVWPTETGISLHTISACKFCPISVMELTSPNTLAIGFQNSDIWVIDINNGLVISKLSLQSDTVSCFSKINSAFCDTDDPFENWTNSALVFGSQTGQICVGTFLTSSIASLKSMKSRITAIIHNKRIIICANAEGDIGIFSYLEKSSKMMYSAHGGSVAALSLFISNGELCFISAGNDKMVKMWKVDRDELCMTLKHEFISNHRDSITSCCWFLSSNEQNEIQFLTGSHDNNVILHIGDSKTVYSGLKTSVEYIGFNDKCILGCGSDGSVAIWSKDGKLLSNISGVEQSSVVLSFSIDKDSDRNFDVTLAFVDKDGSVKIRKPLQRVYSCSLEGHSKGITSCCVNLNKEIISCSLDGTVSLWKLPKGIEDTFLIHSASVTDIIVSVADSVALSSDVCGSIILWELSQSSEGVSLVYGTKKTYMGGFVKSLSRLKDKEFVCAVTQTIADREVYFVDILSYECSVLNDCKSYNLGVTFTHYFESEILCLNGNSSSKTIVASLKSGDFVVITPNMKKKLKTSEDWILHSKITQSEASAEHVYLSLLNGAVKCFEIEDILKCSDYAKASFHNIHSVKTGAFCSYTSAFCENEGSVFCGDTKGWLRIYSKKNPSVTKKVHTDSLSSVSIVGKYIFTCSLDRTLKGWDLETLKQVCQYHSSVPITCLVAFTALTESSYMLLIGTNSGAVQLLKFYPD